MRLKRFFQQYKDLFLLLLLSLTPLFWYGLEINKMIDSFDVGYPFNPLEFIKNGQFLWFSSLNFGNHLQGGVGNFLLHGYEALFTFVSQSVFLGQELYVIAWFLVQMLAMYYLVKKLSCFKDKPYMALFAAILFQFNLFQWQGTIGLWRTRLSVYAALPLVLLFLMDFFEGRRKLFRTAVLIGLTMFFLNGGGSPPLYGALLVLVFATILFYLIINFPKKFLATAKKSVLFFLLSGVIFFVTSLWWILPYLHFSIASYNSLLEASGGPTLMLSWSDEVGRNASVLNLLRLQGLDFLEITAARDFIRVYFTNPFLVAVSFLLPIIAFSSLYWAKKIEEKKYVLLFSFLAIMGIVFTAGSHEPFRGFFIFLLKNVPGFPIFRTTIYKFGGLLWFSYSVLLAFSLSSLIEWTKTFLQKRNILLPKIPLLFASLFIILILLFDFPIFNNKSFVWNAKDSLTLMEKVPSYVFDFGHWVDKQDDVTEKMLLLPEVDRNWFAETYKWGYWSLVFVNTFLTRKNTVTLTPGLTKPEFNLVDSLYKELRNNDANWQNFARFLNIRYLLLRKDYFYDLSMGPTVSPFLYEKVLAKNKNVEKIKTIGEWVFYKINDVNPLGKIYSPNEKIFYTTGQEENIADLLVFLASTKNYPKQSFVFIPVGKNTIDAGQDKVIIISGPMDLLLPAEKTNLLLPKPRFLPGSPFYFLTESKEKELLQKNNNNPKELINTYLGLSLKRLAEMDVFLKAGANISDFVEILGRYGVLIAEVRKEFDVLPKNSKETNFMLTRARDLLLEERNILAIKINEQKSTLNKEKLQNSYRALGDIIRSLNPVDMPTDSSEFEKSYFDKNVVILTSGYRWQAPTSSLYEIYLSNSSILRNSEQLTIDVDGKKVDYKQITPLRPAEQDSAGQANIPESWEKIGEVNLGKGEHGLKITADGIAVYSFKKGDIVFYNRLKTEDVRLTTEKTQAPVVKYTKINPTRYKVEVSSGVQPLTLVFNEKFDKDWKIYVKDVRDKTYDLSKNSQSGIISFFLSHISYVLNLLNDNIFNTLFLKPLPEQNHFMANGYANAYKIEKSNIKNQNDDKYEFIIEYWPQRLLWLGYSVSIVSVLSAIAYLVIRRKKA